jgi:hypothetical protein
LRAKKKEQREKEKREKQIAKEEAILATQQDLNSKKERLASIAQAILADPETQVNNNDNNSDVIVLITNNMFIILDIKT